MSLPESMTRYQFQTTQWSLIHSLNDPDVKVREGALSELCRQYWPPVYAFLRRRGHSPEESTELTQAFFSSVVLERSLFQRADESRGHLRTLLLKCLGNFLVDAARSETTRTRIHDKVCEMDIREEEGRLEHASGCDADAFERRWAIAQIEESARRCREHFQRIGKPAHWEVFYRHVLGPTISTVKSVPLATLAEQFGFESSAATAAAIQVVKRRLGVALDQVVAEGIPDGGSVSDEIHRLRAILTSR